MPQADSRNKLTLRQQSIYLLPNLFTLAALFAGFFAVVQAMNQRFETAAVAVFIAMVLDGMDGRVARMTHSQSAFGAEFDSLSDMVSFGVAPGLIMYQWTLSGLGKAGWLAAFVYTAGAALRLRLFACCEQAALERGPKPRKATLDAGNITQVCADAEDHTLGARG